MSTAWDVDMAADGGDTSWWIGFYGIVATLFAAFVGWIMRGIAWAATEGRTNGQMIAWRERMEENIKSASADRLAIEARLNIRIAAIEARKDRIDDTLRQVPSRDEMNDGFDRITRQIEALSAFVHSSRGDSPRRD